MNRPATVLDSAAAMSFRPRMPVAEPQKELRFTRSGQAAVFVILGSVLAMAALVFFLLEPTSLWWGLIPLVLAIVCGRVTWHCTRHAYLILSPIGVEIFPFFRPEKGMQLIPWGQIAAIEINEPLTKATLHFTAEKTAGIHLTLRPITAKRRPLLAKALTGVMAQREA